MAQYIAHKKKRQFFNTVLSPPSLATWKNEWENSHVRCNRLDRWVSIGYFYWGCPFDALKKKDKIFCSVCVVSIHDLSMWFFVKVLLFPKFCMKSEFILMWFWIYRMIGAIWSYSSTFSSCKYDALSFFEPDAKKKKHKTRITKNVTSPKNIRKIKPNYPIIFQSFYFHPDKTLETGAVFTHWVNQN